MISSLEAIFCEKIAESTERIRKIAKQECPEAPKGWQIWQMWVMGPSNPPAMLRAGAMGKGREGKGINLLPRDWEGKDLLI